MASAAAKIKASDDIRTMQNLLPFYATDGDKIFRERIGALKEIINAAD